MGVKILSRSGGDGKNCITTYLCDAEADVSTLSTEKTVGICGSLCSAGSMAIVIEPKAVYMLNTQSEWKLWT